MKLKELAASAALAAGDGNVRAELAAWREALDFLPPDTRQYQTVAAKVDELSRRVGALADPAAPAQPKLWQGGGLVAAVSFAVWKLKAVLGLLVANGKFLALGFGNAATMGSMLLSLGVYWAAFGWKLALGLIVSIYIHEMGHVDALRRFGIRGSAPMFIPGFGALVRIRQQLANPAENARVGLAGPMWGLAAAIGAWLLHAATGAPILAAIARWGAWINLFNLLPVWQLDGSRAFIALSRLQRWLAAAALAAAWFATGEGLLIILAAVTAFEAWRRTAPAAGERTTLVQYIVLVGALSALAVLPVPMAPAP